VLDQRRARMPPWRFLHVNSWSIGQRACAKDQRFLTPLPTPAKGNAVLLEREAGRRGKTTTQSRPTKKQVAAVRKQLDDL
jgi:hypothetical protein